MKISLKLIVLFLCIILLESNSLKSQTENSLVSEFKTLPNSFILHGALASKQIEEFGNFISKADFEQYRLRDDNVKLTFKNGFTLELISAKDLTIKNKIQTINPNNYPNKSSIALNYVYPIFEITKSGWILAEVQPTLSKKETN